MLVLITVRLIALSWEIFPTVSRLYCGRTANAETDSMLGGMGAAVKAETSSIAEVKNFFMIYSVGAALPHTHFSAGAF